MRLPDDYCQRIYAGEHPVKVWREFRGMEQTDLRREAKIGVPRIEQIEQGKGRPIHREEAKILGRVLGVTSHNLMPHHESYRGCSSLDVDEDAIIAEAEYDEPQV